MPARGVAAYSLVHAAVRALKSNMLSEEMWTALIQAQDFEAILNLLSKTVYGPYLNIEHPGMTPRRAVYQTRWHLAGVFEKLIQLTDEPGKQLLLQIWHGYEVDNLKATLRGIENGASWDQVLHLLSPMKKFVRLTTEDMERMIRSGSIAHAIDQISHSPYYDTLRHALARYQAEESLFPLEVALDIDTHRKLWESIQQLKGLDHTHALRLVGTIIDVDNILWAIRYRVYHHLSEQEIINYTLPFGYKVKDEDIRAIAAGSDITMIVRRIYPDLPGIGQLIDRPGPELLQLERVLQRHIAAECRATFLGNPFHIGVPLAFLYLNEFEIRNLTTLIEAKSSHLPNEMCVNMLVM